MEDLQVKSKEQTEILVIANNINDGLKAFEEKKSELTKLKEDAAGLTIESIDDKEAIKTVATWRKSLKAARVEIQKQGKAMRDPLTKISKSISAKEDELIDIISPTEKDLQEKEDWVESEKKKLSEAEEARKQAIIQQRIDKLAAFGFAIDIIFLQGLDEAQFEKVLANAQAEFEKEEAKKAEDARLEQEKQAQIAKDLADLSELRRKQAEADRIIKENDERIEKERLAKERNEKLEAERLLKEKSAAEEKLWRGRLEQLEGVEWNGQEAFSKNIDGGIVVTYDQLLSFRDSDFNILRDAHNEKNAASVEKKRVEAEQKAIADEKVRQEELAKFQKEEIERGIAFAIQKEADEKAVAELKKEQELSLSKDKVKYQDTVDYLLKAPIHEMRSGTYRAKMKVIRDFLDGLK